MAVLWQRAKANISVGTGKYFNQVLLVTALAVLAAVLSLVSPHFWQWDNAKNILEQTAVLIVMSVAMTIVIASGGIDLSVGGVVALSGIVAGLCLKAGATVAAAVTCALGLGSLVGLLNGSLISLLDINPFIVTLGCGSIARGLALILTQGIPIYGFGSGFACLGKGNIMGLTVPVWLALAVALLGWVAATRTKLGLYASAMGENEEALLRTGVPVGWYKTGLYAICGTAAALVGLVLASRLNTADPTVGLGYELQAIAATVLGGTSMKGGASSIPGTVIACLLLGVLANGLTIVSVQPYYQQLLIGIIIIAAVIVSERKK